MRVCQLKSSISVKFGREVPHFGCRKNPSKPHHDPAKPLANPTSLGPRCGLDLIFWFGALQLEKKNTDKLKV